ncbi:hypothetical protein LCL95_10925 [Bacillus timonensis]|nr:hypothetical protein [Bacillus timonensis]
MSKEKIVYTGPLTGTIGEAKQLLSNNQDFSSEFGEEFDPIQQMWRINPVDEADYDGTVGYKDS